jgi:hypothetical protein
MAAMTVAEINTYIRTVLDLTTTQISDAKLNLFINNWVAYYSEITELNQWLITYNSAVSALESMILSVSTSGNDATRRRKQRGNESVEVYYQSGGLTVSYQMALDTILANPSLIHPSLKPNVLNIAVGGVSESTTSEIKQDPDSRSAALGVGWLHDEEYNLTGTSPQPRIYPRGSYGEF